MPDFDRIGPKNVGRGRGSRRGLCRNAPGGRLDSISGGRARGSSADSGFGGLRGRGRARGLGPDAIGTDTRSSSGINEPQALKIATEQLKMELAAIENRLTALAAS
jgi:hypothetical protein